MIIEDTIVALATPPGKGGVAVVRISGMDALSIARQLTKQDSFEARYARFSRFYNRQEQVIDEGITLFFPAPRSFTGEDVVELHIHGGPILVDEVLEQVLLGGARQARPGEFSERAFLNGKMDLLQAEAIADLIDSSSRQAARAAVRSLQGEFSERVNSIVEQLTEIRVYLEASLDFPDEEIDLLTDGKIKQRLFTLQNTVQETLHCAQQGAIYREGITVVIVGEPNVGKSTLLNKLSGTEVAIVTDIPGTTRDIMREQILIEGIPVHVIDTAGIRQTHDIVEQEGVRRAHHAMTQADVVLKITDIHLPNNAEIAIELPENVPVLNVVNKVDCLVGEALTTLKKDDEQKIYISAKTGYGIEKLREQLKALSGSEAVSSAHSFSARRRHLDALERTDQLLKQSMQQLEQMEAIELVTEKLRQSQNILGEVTGKVTSDDLLGKIFSNFCIGK